MLTAGEHVQLWHLKTFAPEEKEETPNEGVTFTLGGETNDTLEGGDGDESDKTPSGDYHLPIFH